MQNKYDITGKIGPLFLMHSESRIPEWPMYSYERPAYMLWNTIYNRLREHGWTEEQAGDWLKSKEPRWALNGRLGDAIKNIAIEYADYLVNVDKS
jgi:hypothetical protein